MTVEETIKLLALIKLAYPEAYRDADSDTLEATINMWHKHFSCTPYPIMELALDHFVKRSKFHPKIADIYEEMRKLNGEAFSNLWFPQDETNRKAVQYIYEHTKRYDERNARAICFETAQNMLPNRSLINN